MTNLTAIVADHPLLHEPTFRYCVAFLRNGGERVRAIALVRLTTGISVLEARDYVDTLSKLMPLESNRAICWLCGAPGELQEVVVERETPNGKPCPPKAVKVHFACWQDMEP